MKRQRSRNRNGGGGGGGGGKPQHNTNRAFDSNGPEGVKVRGAAQHVYEKYQQLARDAQTSGDRVLAENYLQHAEHYFRLMRAMQPQRPLSEIIGRDQFVSGYDIDFEDEGSAADAIESEQEAEAAESQEAGGDRSSRYEPRRDDFRQGDGRQGDGRQGEARQRDDQPRQDRYQQNDRGPGERAFGDRPAQDRAQSDRPQSDRRQSERGQSDRGFSDRPREDRGPRNGADDRPRFNRDDRPSRAERPDRDPLGVIEPEATPLTAPSVQPSEAPMLRADDGEISHAPAFLQVRPAEDGEEPRRPRRRRVTAAAVTAEQPPAASPAVSDET
jgi:hypothetical protein